MIISILVQCCFILCKVNIRKFNITFEQYLNHIFFGMFKQYQTFLIIQACAIFANTPTEIRKGNAYFVCKNWLFYYLLLIFKQKGYRIENGLSLYLQKMVENIQESQQNKIHLSTEIVSVKKNENNKLTLIDINGKIYADYDHVVICCDAVNAGNILNEINSELSSMLTKFKYNKETIIIHTDETLIQSDKSTWSMSNVLYSHNELNKEDIIMNFGNYKLNNTNKNYFKLWWSLTSKIPNSSQIVNQCDFQHITPSYHNVVNTKYLNTLHLVQGKHNIWIAGHHIHQSNIFSHESAVVSAIKIVKQIAPKSQRLRSILSNVNYFKINIYRTLYGNDTFNPKTDHFVFLWFICIFVMIVCYAIFSIFW
eukprot:133611_1